MVSPARVGAAPVIGSDELDALSLGLAVVDARWEILRWNRALADLTGIPTHEALGFSLWDRLPALTGARTDAALRAAMRDRVAYRGPAMPLSGYDMGPVLRAVAPLGDDALLLELDRDSRGPDETAALDSVLAARVGESDILATVTLSIADSSVALDTALAALAETRRWLDEARRVVGLQRLQRLQSGKA